MTPAKIVYVCAWYIFSRLYLSKGRAVVMVVARPSVTNVLWLNGAR